MSVSNVRRRAPRCPVSGGVQVYRREGKVRTESQQPFPPYRTSSACPCRITEGDGSSSGQHHSGSSGGDHGSSHNGKTRRTSLFQRFCRSEALWLGGIILFLSGIWEAVLSRQDVLQEKLWQCFSITLEVRSSQQPEYSMIVDWMARQGEQSRNLTLRPVLHRNSGLSNKSGRDEVEQEEDARALLVPGYGRHLLRTPDGVWLWVHRLEDQNKNKRETFSSAMAAASGGAGVVVGEHDVLRLTFFTRNRDVLNRFLSTVRESWRRHTQRHLSLYTTDYACSWRLLAHRPLRPVHTLYLPPSVKSLVDEVRVFLKLGEVYRSLGIPWRRGYLFEGPPGTGKTSFVMALASSLQLPLYLLPLHTEDMDDESLIRLVSCLPPRCVLLVEDVENSLGSVESREQASLPSSAGSSSSSSLHLIPKSKISMGAFLNALDGVASSEGRVLVMTTNNVSSIPHPQAMLRPGRIDKIVHFSPLREEERQEMKRAYERTLQEKKVCLPFPSSSVFQKPEDLRSSISSSTPFFSSSTEDIAPVVANSGKGGDHTSHASTLSSDCLVSPIEVPHCSASVLSSSSLPSPSLPSTSNLSPAEYQLALLDHFLSAAVRQEEAERKEL